MGNDESKVKSDRTRSKNGGQKIAKKVFKSKREEKFDDAMKRAGMKIHEVDGDGNCLFRAVSFQAYGSENKHKIVRKKCLQYIGLEKEYFANFIPGGLDYIDEYIAKKSKDGSWGDDIEIQAMSEIYDRSVEIYAYEITPMRTFHETKKNKNAPFRLSYHGKNHYNAVVSSAWGKDYRLISSQPGLIEDTNIAIIESQKYAGTEEESKVESPLPQDD